MNPFDPCGPRELETRRLMLQHQIYGPISRRFLDAAGIGRGMKVLDVGSSTGDMTVLLADLVGPRGQVVGVDVRPDAIAAARVRMAAEGWENVSFVAGDVRDLDLDTDFDALVARWVLMYLPDPAEVLHHLVARLRPGGIAAIHENDVSYPSAVFPPTELSRQLQRWTMPPAVPDVPEVQMGARLFKTYLDAGLPAPEMLLEAPVGGGPDWPGYEYAVEMFRAALPSLASRGVVRPEEVGIDTLTDRLRADVVRVQGIQMLPILIGAWARKHD
ncbi:MAG TPA: methyltransferase domain-containing protein [Candidatus Eisenbacteria bacterium]|nr:methyltransferase domain-containing protein [Candidatus Eisenbacteria bacterium]